MEITTHEQALEAVRQNGRALKDVPAALRTPALCLEAVRQHGHALQFVPEVLRTPELCVEAVRKDGWALQFVPEALRTPELCLEAVRKNGGALGYVPEGLRTPEICLKAVRQNGLALEFVPQDFRTPEICLEAVKQSGWALEYVPDRFRTPALCLEAVRQHGHALQFVPDRFRTPEICLEAVRDNGYALKHVPKPLRTPELRAVLAESELLYWVRREFGQYEGETIAAKIGHHKFHGGIRKNSEGFHEIKKHLTMLVDWKCDKHGHDGMVSRLCSLISEKFGKAEADNIHSKIMRYGGIRENSDGFHVVSNHISMLVGEKINKSHERIVGKNPFKPFVNKVAAVIGEKTAAGIMRSIADPANFDETPNIEYRKSLLGNLNDLLSGICKQSESAADRLALALTHCDANNPSEERRVERDR